MTFVQQGLPGGVWIAPAGAGRWVALALLLTALIGVLDYLSGYELRLGSLYLLPIMLATWSAGHHAGLSIAAAACLCWLLSFNSSHGYARPELFYWDGLVMVVVFIVFVILLTRLRLALQRADERFVRVLDEMHAAVYVMDAHSGRILYANRRLAEMIGAEPNGLCAADLPQYLTGGDGDHRRSVLPTSHGFSSEERRDPASGRWYLVQFGAIPWQDTSAVTLIVVTDISDRRHAQFLRRENRDMMYRTSRLSALAEATSVLAHEINQPLMAIASYNDACLRLLASETMERAELAHALEKSRGQAIRAGNIVTRMRNFVRSKHPQPVLCELNAIVREAIELMEARIEDHCVVVTMMLAEHLPPILADRFLLEQVVVNLLENAVEAMRPLAQPRRRLTVSTGWQPAGAIIVSISDHGEGIPAAIDKYLYTPFRSTKPEGLGLGLSICRSVVEAHGGRLWHDPNPGGGTIFHFTIAAGDA